MENNYYYQHKDDIIALDNELMEEYGMRFSLADIVGEFDRRNGAPENAFAQAQAFYVFVRKNGGLK